MNKENKYQKEIEELSFSIEEMNRKKIQAETRLESLQEKEEALLSQCEKLNISPHDLPAVISELESEIESSMKKIKQLLSNEAVSNESSTVRFEDSVDSDMPF